MQPGMACLITPKKPSQSDSGLSADARGASPNSAIGFVPRTSSVIPEGRRGPNATTMAFEQAVDKYCPDGLLSPSHGAVDPNQTQLRSPPASNLRFHCHPTPSMSAEPRYTMLLFFQRNPSLSPAEFRTYYEANHVPMVMEIAKEAKGLLTYTRRYLDHKASDPALASPFTVFGNPAPTVPYDIVNEVTFETRKDAAEFARIMYDVEENRAKVLEDENKLFVRSQMRGMIVQTVAS